MEKRNIMLTKRAVLCTGYSCNARCSFCYYLGYLNKGKDLSTSCIYKILKFIKSVKGIEELDITGGEPTIRRDIFEIIEHAKNLGFKNICIISNAIKLADLEFTDRLVRTGAGEFLLTLEGQNSQLHDRMVGAKGAFEKLLKAVENIHQTGAKLRFNIVITKVNFNQLPQIAKLLVKLNPKNVNLIHYNPILKSSAGLNEHLLMYSQSAPLIKEAIGILEPNIEDLFARYIPFCFLTGYERFLCNYYQIQYDKYEWDHLLCSRLNHKLLLHLLKLLIGLAGFKNFDRLKEIDWQEAKHEAVIRAKVIYSHRKSKTCKGCRFDLICEGVWKEYAKNFGTGELKTQPGAKIDNPLYFKEI